MPLAAASDFGRDPGFSDAVRSSQAVFRAVMNAMARPGSIHAIPDVSTPQTLAPAMAAVALSLFDQDTPFWIGGGFYDAPAIAHWLRFQTGAPPTEDASRAAFALIADSANLPDFSAFALGTLEYPDRSTTLVIKCQTLTEGGPLILTGPGIDGKSTLDASALPFDFIERMHVNHALFPRGVDLLLVCGNQLAALPRSTHVSTAEL